MIHQAPGALLSYLIAAVILTLPVSLMVLGAYRRAVRKTMRTRSGPGEIPPTWSAPAQVISDGSRVRNTCVAGTEVRTLRRLARIYLTAGILAAAIVTVFEVRAAGLPFNSLLAFMTAYIFAWPLIPTLSILLDKSPRQTVGLVVGYLLLGAAVELCWSLASRFGLGRHYVHPLMNVRGYGVQMLGLAAGPFAIVLASSIRKVRPVVPLVLAGLLMFSFGALAIRNAFIQSFDVAALRPWMSKLGYLPVFMAASLPAGYLCWRLQGWLVNRYRAKRSSDIQFLVDMLWLIAIFCDCVILSVYMGWRALEVLVAFVGYRLVVAGGLAHWRPSSKQPPPSRLLLLRAFGLPRRAERLFDVVGHRWRFDGNVNLIAGADLAGRTIDSGDILAFVGGDLRSRFVRGEADLAERVAARDEGRDPDGRFRVNSFLCFEDTWQRTLALLLRHTDVVLMDLRGFSQENRGCLFEIERLVEHALLERAFFVLDDGSDEGLLRDTVLKAQKGLGLSGTPRLETVRLAGRSRAELQSILARLRILASAT